MKIIKTLSLIVAVFAITSCQDYIYEFPDERAVDPTEIKIDLKLNITTEFRIFTQFSTTRAISGTLRGIVDVYEVDDAGNIGDTPVARATVYKTDLTEDGDYILDVPFTLHARKYRILVWNDFTEQGGSNIFYATEDLKGVNVKLPYQGSNDAKDGFSGSADLDLTPYREVWDVNITLPVNLERPFAKIEVVTTDLELYYEQLAAKGGVKSGSNLTAEFSYAGFFPTSYNVHTGKPNDASVGIKFNSTLLQQSSKEAQVAYDYVFVNGLESAVTVDMTFYDDGKPVNVVTGISIPTKRGRLTTIRGDFLTRQYKPGININPNYDGKFDITID